MISHSPGLSWPLSLMFQAVAIAEIFAPMLMDHMKCKSDVAELQRQCKQGKREREREGEIRLTMCTHTDLAYVHHSVLLFYENGHFDPVGSATYIDLHRFGSIWIIYHES